MTHNLLMYGWPVLAFAIWFGLSVGSFLNVVVYRLPEMLKRDWEAEAKAILKGEHQSNEDGSEDDTQAETFNLMVPRSRCPKCQAPISALQNIPVVSWLVLKGKCGNCANPISARYPVVELLTGIATLYVLALFGYSWLALAVCFFTWTLIALTLIDFDTQFLPDQMTLPLLWLGLTINLTSIGFVTLSNAVVGAMIGYLSLWSIYWLFKLITGKEGMGYGDFKLLAAAGAWAGWQVLPGVVMIASVAGLIYAIATSIAGKREGGQPIAFGPFLAVGAWVSVLHRDMLLGLYL